VRLLLVTSLLAVVTAGVALAASATTSQAPTGGFGSPSCLRGDWVAGRAETSRVLRALVPVDGIQVKGKLYMQFHDGRFQYGSTGLVTTIGGGGLTLSATGRFFSLHRYTATPGVLQLANGERTTAWGRFTATKDGKTVSVKGPPTKTQRAAGGITPFQCRRNTLRVRLPRFASLNWITLQRA
jgi:hypothetical protein